MSGYMENKKACVLLIQNIWLQVRFNRSGGHETERLERLEVIQYSVNSLVPERILFEEIVVFVHQQPVVLSINQSQQFRQLVISAYNLPAFVLLDVVGQFFFQFGREVSV